jgi:hypothetical protein
MAPKPQARSPAKQAEKAKEKPQHERFIEAAHAVGVDVTGKEFERLFKKVVPPKRPQKFRAKPWAVSQFQLCGSTLNQRHGEIAYGG